MKILHISDLHYKGSTNNLFNSMVEVIAKEDIDFCCFSGDLIDKGGYPLEKAYSILKDELEQRGIKHLFTTCGNHDIKRENISPMFKEYLEKRTQDEVDTFVKKNEANQFLNNLNHLEEYNQLIKKEFGNVENASINELYTINFLDIEGKKISIVSLNTAWAAFEKDTYGKILFPNHILEEINNKIKMSDFKILITHFHYKFLRLDFQKKFSHNMRQYFDSVFLGHSHQNEENNYIYSDTGIFISIAGSLNTSERENYQGFKILDINLNLFTAKVKNYEYMKNQYELTETHYDIPCDEKKREQIKLISLIQNKFINVLNKANNIFLLHKEIENLTFLDIFIDPIIKKTNETELFQKQSKVKIPKINYKTLINNNTNYIIIGKDKSGKSALLYKIYLDMLDNFANNKVIPLYIDMKQYYTNEDLEFNILNIIANEYNMSKNQINKLSKELKLKILVDNYNEIYEEINNKIIKDDNFYLFHSVSYLITILSNQEYEYKIIKCPVPIEKVFLNDIDRKIVRELAYKWPIEEKYDKDDIIEKLTKMFSQLNIHFNFWTVSIFLCVIEKTDSINLNNNTQLIELYIEKLLDRNNLVKNNSNKTSFEIYKNYLSELAHFIYANKSNDNFCLSYSELIQIYEEFKETNIRIVDESKDVVDYLLKKGILFKASSSSYTFRLNGVFEYFLAYYMTRNENFTQRILENDCKYLSFKNELEIYAGIKRNDLHLLKIAYEKTRKIKILLNKTINYEEDIKTTNKDVQSLCEFSKTMREQIKPMDYNQQDILNDQLNPIDNMESSIKVKNDIIVETIDYNNYSNYLFILGRIYRNLDDITNTELLRTIFEFIIDEACMSVCYLIEEYVESLENNDITLKEIKQFKQLVISLTPILSHSILFEMIAHPTLKKLILLEIEKLEKNYRENEFKLFVLYFLLVEIDLEEEIHRVEKLVEKTNTWNILNSIFFKLLLIISFKTNKKEKVQEKIRELLDIVALKRDKREDGKNSEKRPGERINIDQLIREIHIENSLKNEAF